MAKSRTAPADDNLKSEVRRLEGLVQEKEKERKGLEETAKELRDKIEQSREAQEALMKAQEENLQAVEKGLEEAVERLKSQLEVDLLFSSPLLSNFS